MRIREIKLNHTVFDKSLDTQCSWCLNRRCSEYWVLTGHCGEARFYHRPTLSLVRRDVINSALRWLRCTDVSLCGTANYEVQLARPTECSCATNGQRWANLHTCSDWLAHCLVQAIFLLYTTGLHNSCDRWPACIVETPPALAGSRIAGQRFGLLMWVGLRNLAIVSLHGK